MRQNHHRRGGAAALAGLLVVTASACTWVKPTPAGTEVREAKADAVSACEHIGNVAATTKDKIVLKRNAEVMREEQVNLARNQAATMGGDTIVAKEPAQGGTLQFDVYRCR
jgi:Domain of unknown function (DUF4156)